MPFCNKCGLEIPEGSVFCPSCGQKLSTEEKKDDIAKKVQRVSERVSEEGPTEIKINVLPLASLKKILTLNKKAKLIAAGVAVAVLVVAIIVIVSLITSSLRNLNQNPTPTPNPKTVRSVSVAITSTLKEAKLNVVEYPYGGIAEWNHNGVHVGYIKFNGTIKYGVDLEKVIIEDDGSTVTITIPKIEFTTVETDKQSFYYVFDSSKVKKEYNKNEYASEVYAICKNKMVSDISSNSTIRNAAKTNVTQMVESLVKPLAEGRKVKLVFDD